MISNVEQLQFMLLKTGWSFKMNNGLLHYSVFGMGTIEFTIAENASVSEYLDAMIACCHKYCCYFWKDKTDYKKGAVYTQSDLIADLLKEKKRLERIAKS
jgi:hypothetical protein